MTLREFMADLLDQAKAGPPTAKALEAHVAPLAKRITTAGPDLKRASWARAVWGAGDTYLELEGDLAGFHVWEDDRGWGAYAELAVTRGTLADAEAVVGTTEPLPLAPDDFSSGERRMAYVRLGGKTVRVFVELARTGSGVTWVTVHFQR